jgi:hypothetical protein
MPYLVQRMHLLRRHRCDHLPRCFLEHAATKFRTISRSTRLLLPTLRNYFPAESKPFAGTIDAAGEGGSARRKSRPMPAPQRSSWPDRRVASRFHLQRPHGVHATSIPPQSCSLYLGETRVASLSGSARAFFAQRFTGPLDRIRRKTRSIFSGNSHKQAPFPFELDL